MHGGSPSQLLALSAAERDAGVVAVSGGNHGIAGWDGRPSDGGDGTLRAAALDRAHVSPLTVEHVRQLVEEVFVVSDAAAMRGVVGFAEEAKLWVEPATGCLVPAARLVIEWLARLGRATCRVRAAQARAARPGDSH